jgi:hypothetical protein
LFDERFRACELLKERRSESALKELRPEVPRLRLRAELLDKPRPPPLNDDRACGENDWRADALLRPLPPLNDERACGANERLSDELPPL